MAGILLSWTRRGTVRTPSAVVRMAPTGAARRQGGETHSQEAAVAQIDLDKVLDKAYADKDLPTILSAPVSALKGVSDRDGELLQEAFGVKTVADLANLKYARWAQALAALDTSSS